MNFKRFSKYLGLFILGVLLIAVYKTFDNIEYIFGYVKKVFSLLVPFFIGFGIAMLAYPPCAFLEKKLEGAKWEFVRKKRRGISVAIVYLVFLIVISLIIAFVLPGVVKSIYNFIIQLPDMLSNAISFLNSFDYIKYDFSKLFDIEKVWENININNINKYAAGVIGFSSSFIQFFMSIIISIYVLADRKSLKELAKIITSKIFSEKVNRELTKYVKMLSEYVYKYLYCLLLDALVIFVLSLILMLCLKVKYALVLSLFMGVFNLIPYFGAIIAVVVACVITLFSASVSKAVILAVSLTVLQQIDANIIQPKLVNNSFSIKPFWVILGVILGGGLFGTLGIILAVPVMGLIKYIFNEHIGVTDNEGEN